MSAMFAAPPGTAATTASTCSCVRSASSSISGVITSAPAGIRFGGTRTAAVPGDACAAARPAARPAGVGAANGLRTLTGTPRTRRFSTSATASSE
jgi:hypothetical protein